MVTTAAALPLLPMQATTDQQIKQAPCGNAFGHVFKVIGNGICDVAQGVYKGAQKVFWAVFHIKEDSSALQHGLKLVNFGLMGIGAIAGHPPFVGNFKKDSNVFTDVVDAVQIFNDADYVIAGKFKDDFKEGRIGNILARIVFIVSDIGTTILWAAEIGVLKLAQIVEAMGKVPVLNLIVKLPLVEIVNKATFIGYALWVADALQRIIMKDSFADKMQALLELAQYGIEVTVRVFIIFGCSNPIVLITLGVTAAGFGVCAFLYKTYQNDVKEEVKIQAAAAA